MPATGQDKESSFAHRNFKQGGAPLIKARQDPGVFDRRRIQLAMFPEMDLRKIAEARIRKRREDRMLKVDLPKQRVFGAVPVGRGLLHFEGAQAEQFRES